MFVKFPKSCKLHKNNKDAASDKLSSLVVCFYFEKNIQNFNNLNISIHTKTIFTGENLIPEYKLIVHELEVHLVAKLFVKRRV